jgi:hypothetical protein
MADKNLILGARLAAGGFNTGLADTIDKSIQRTTNSLLNMAQYQMQHRAEIDRRAFNILNKFPEEINFSKLDNVTRESLTPWAFDNKNKFYNLANLLAEATPGSQEFMNYQNQLSAITQSYNNVNDNLLWLQSRRKEYSENHNRISKGFDAGKKGALDNILLPDELDYTVTYDDFGNPTYKTTHDGKNYEFTKKDFDWFEQDDEYSIDIGKYYSAAEENGLKGIDYSNQAFNLTISNIEREVRQLIENGGEERILSILYDDMFANSFTDLDRSKFYEDPMAAKEIIIQKTIQAIKTGNSNAYEVWKKSQKPEETSFGQSLRDDIAVTETQFNQALDFAGVTGKRKNFNVNKIKADLQRAAGVNSKAVILTKEEFVQRLIDQDSSDPIKTKEDVFKLYEEKELYIDSNNSGYFQPVPYSIGNAEDLFNLYIDMSEMSDDVKAYWRTIFKQRYRKPKNLPGLDIPNNNKIDFKL